MNHPSIPLDHHCNVIHYESVGGIWALDKATGILSHPNKERKKGKPPRTLLNADYNHDEECYTWVSKDGEQKKLYLVHRLDSPTSGVLIATSHLSTATIIKDLFRNKEVQKTYFALIRPKGAIKEGIWKDYLKEKRIDGKIRVMKGNGSVALTKASIERKKGGLYGLAMVRLQPLTGRTHQLRVQCALHGHSIIGDKSYGDFSFNRKISRATKIDRLCLHAGEIEFKLTIEGKTVNFFADAPLPRSLGKLLL